MNAFKTTILLTGLTLLLVLSGEYFGGTDGALIAFAIAAATNFFSYFYSDKLALAMYRAQPVTREELPRAYEVVERLTAKAGIPMPRIYVIPTDSPNAFATGRNPQHASVAVTHGILGLLNDEELEGVLAHELGHVRNRDILTSSIAATIASAITWAAQMAFFFGGRRDDDEGGNPIAALLMMLLAPIAAGLIQMAISRTREFSADAASAQYTGNPDELVSALRKLEAYSKRIPMDVSPSMSHMYIIQPLSGKSLASLFSTHPPTEERIARLLSLRRS